MSQINLLNHNVGIQQILDNDIQEHIPNAKALASTMVNKAGLEEYFTMSTSKTNIEKSLSPELGDGENLRPDVFNNTLNSLITEFSENSDPAVNTMLNDVLKPLAENKELLNAYSNLMIGG